MDDFDGCPLRKTNPKITLFRLKTQKEIRKRSQTKTPKRAENGALGSSKSMLSLKAGCKFQKIQRIKKCLHFGSILGSFWEPKSLLYYFLACFLRVVFSSFFEVEKERPRSHCPTISGPPGLPGGCIIKRFQSYKDTILRL